MEMISLEKFIEGTCTAMCPLQEIQMREAEGLLHFLEIKQNTEYQKRPQADCKKVVKAYHRSAAGQKMPKPSDLRSIDTLVKTVRYLLRLAYDPPLEKDWLFVYEFVADRLRAVRQDMVIQGLSCEKCLTVLETMVIFHIYAGYRLCDRKIEAFDPKMNGDMLMDSLGHCLPLYNMNLHSKHRGLIESLYALVTLGNNEALNRLTSLPQTVRCRDTNMALDFSIVYICGNFVRCFRLLNQMSPILACAIVPHLPQIRRQALQILSKAYNNKVLKVPASAVAKWLSVSPETAIAECEYYGVQSTHGNIHFLKDNFKKNTHLMKCRKLDWLDEKLKNTDLKMIFFASIN